MTNFSQKKNLSEIDGRIPGTALLPTWEVTHCEKLASVIHLFQRVALQFPDAMLAQSAEFARQIKQKVKEFNAAERDPSGKAPQIFILADTSNDSSCCVDEVAAEHYLADCIIHFGNACLSYSGRSTPVLFEFPYSSFDLAAFERAVKTSGESRNGDPLSSTLLLIYPVEFHHMCESLCEILLTHTFHNNLLVAIPRLSQGFLFSPRREAGMLWLMDRQIFRAALNHGRVEYEPVCCGQVDVNPESISFIYIGNVDQEWNAVPFARRFLLRFGANYHVTVYDPRKKELGLYDKRPLQKLLAQRFVYLTRAAQSQRFGLVYGTVGVENFRKVHRHLGHCLLRQDKHFVSIVIGKVSSPKFENFTDVGAFCYINCPESSFVADPRDFSRPILTPFEIQVLCQAREWSTDYILEFAELLETTKNVTPEALSTFCNAKGLSDTKPVEPVGAAVATIPIKCGALLPTSLKSQLIPLSSLPYQGVPTMSETSLPNFEVHQGLSGIASAYVQELNATQS